MSPKQLEILFKAYRRLLYSISEKIVGTMYAEDMMMETFLSAAKQNEVNEYWLRVTVKRKCLDFLKMNKRRDRRYEKIIFEYDEYTNAVEVKSDLIELILKQVDEMPRVQKDVFLSWINGYEPKEIAQKLKIKISTVGVLLMRSRTFCKNIKIEL